MATTESISDEWMYDDELTEINNRESDLVRRVSIDSTDLLDDVLTLPSSITKQETDPEELNFIQEPETENGIEDSGSARYNAEQLAKTVQSRIESNKTSQSIATQFLNIYSREPNKKNSVFIGNMTWWTTDMDVVSVVKEVGLGDIKCIKFFENRTNGQSKGYAMAELSSEAFALGAPDKLQVITLHGKNLIAAYAGRITAVQFEAKCQGKVVNDKPQIKAKTTTQTFRPPNANVGGFQQGLAATFPGLRPPDMSTLPFTAPFPPTVTPPIPPGVPTQFDPSVAAAFMKPQNVPAAPHLNPAFLQDMTQGGNNVAELFAKAAAQFHHQNAAAVKNRPTEEEIADANQRNRAISSSAISRAMSDANGGDYESAVDTLKMAITLIKQSVTAGLDSSQMLIQSLQDCLHGIEHQSGNKRIKERHDGRDKRSGRGSSNTKHRDRSRERRR